MSVASAAHLVYHAVTGWWVEEGPAECFVCGCSCQPATVALPEQFLEMHRCVGRGAAMCAACAHVFTPRLYQRLGSALLTAVALRPLGREDLNAVLFEEPWPDEPYAVVVSATKLRVQIPWAPVMQPGAWPRVLFEQDMAKMDRESLAPVRESYRWLYERFSRQQILEDRYPYLAKFAEQGGSVAQWMEHRAVVAPWLASTELALIAYITVRDFDGRGHRVDS